MEKKFEVTAPKKGDTIEIVGLDEVIFQAIDAESLLGKYERFAEHVVLSCAMPEIPRYTLHDDTIEGTPMPQAFEMLDRLLVRYRKMTAWFRANKIDPEAVVGGGNNGGVKS